MKKKITISIIIINIIAIPIIGESTDWDLVSFYKNLKEILIFQFSIISFIIAISLYDKFGIDKKLTEKRIELVLELITELKAIEGFTTTIYVDGKPLQNVFCYFESNMKKRTIEKFKIIHGGNNSYIDEPININIEDFNTTFEKVRKLLNSPLIPKSILEKGEFLRRQGGHNNEELRARKAIVYICFSSEAHKKLIQSKGGAFLVSFNNDCTLGEFIIKFEDILKSCQIWTDKYSDISEGLNFKNF